MVLSRSCHMLLGMSAGPERRPGSLLAAHRPGRRVPGRRSARPRPAYAGAALLVAGVGLGATTALTITAETASQLTATGGLATFAGNLTGMVGTYLALMMVLLVSRLPRSRRRWTRCTSSEGRPHCPKVSGLMGAGV